MKLGKNIVLMLLLFAGILHSQEERKVLVEVFTNSHCSLCPAAHNIIDNYLAGPNGDKISYVYYHMIYPYSDDPLYWQSQAGSDARDNYYNPVAATPQGWFDGIHQGSSSGWTSSLNNLVSTQSPLKIILDGSRSSNQFYINAELTRTGSIADNDLVIHFLVVEDLFFDGRNSVSNHKHVMRKMLPTPDGQTFSIDLNETKDFAQTIDLDPIWDADSLKIVVFVQSIASKTIYQSETINYNDLVVSVDSDSELQPKEIILEQNYPNPFNPSTTIEYQIPSDGFVSLTVYNTIGQEVSALVNKNQTAGKYSITFSGEKLPSGLYFYTIRTGDLIETRKMILLK